MKSLLFLAAFAMPWLTASRGPSVSLTPAWVYNVASGLATETEATETTFTYGAPLTANQSGSVTKVSAWLLFSHSGHSLKAAIYDTSLNLLGSGSASLTESSNVDVEVTLSVPVSVTASTGYIVLFTPSSSSAGNVGFSGSGGAASGRIDFSNGYTGFPLNPATVSNATTQYRVGMFITP